MTRKYKTGFIEVSEDAYKQNWVYRPWPQEPVKKAESRPKGCAQANSIKVLRTAYH